MEEIYISEATREALEEATQILGAHYCSLGLPYSPQAVARSLTHWLEVCIEELASEAVWHCVEGDRATAFNRRAFEQQLWRQPSEQPKLAA